MTLALKAAESGWLPDLVVRAGVRALLRERLRQQRRLRVDGEELARARHLAAMCESPIAASADVANAQHYAVPPAFFELVLGPRLKYSCCRWETGAATLAQAEDAMLQLTTERAGLQDGMRVLDLGCGWGSWTLWAASLFPRSRFVAMSNSPVQRRYIEARIASQGLENVAVITSDINAYVPDGTFDRIVSVEMFEHMRNYERLFSRMRTWLRPEGRLFVHVFCHRGSSYFFDDGGATDWMARHFFTGGMMPSDELLHAFGRWFDVEAQWRVDGREYRQTAEAWLRNLDQNRVAVESVLGGTQDRASARRDVERWRLFFLACSELFGYRGGQEWFVSHYVLRPALDDAAAFAAVERTRLGGP